jgi:hypothetical protein
LRRQPELEQAAKPALIGVHLDKGENGRLIQSGVRLESKAEIAQISGHRRPVAAARISIPARSRSETKTLSGRFLSRLSSTFCLSTVSAFSFPARIFERDRAAEP